jgi:hypothetical protein
MVSVRRRKPGNDDTDDGDHNARRNDRAPEGTRTGSNHIVRPHHSKKPHAPRRRQQDYVESQNSEADAASGGVDAEVLGDPDRWFRPPLQVQSTFYRPAEQDPIIGVNGKKRSDEHHDSDKDDSTRAGWDRCIRGTEKTEESAGSEQANDDGEVKFPEILQDCVESSNGFPALLPVFEAEVIASRDIWKRSSECPVERDCRVLTNDRGDLSG